MELVTSHKKLITVKEHSALFLATKEKTMLKRLMIAISLMTLLITGCDIVRNKLQQFRTATTTGQPESATSAVENKTAAKTCKNGSAPKIISGNCSGEWKYQDENGATACNFVWGPKVTCPSGMKSLSVEASCYGTTAKELSHNDNVYTAEECSSTFGNPPKPIKYEMFCCED